MRFPRPQSKKSVSKINLSAALSTLLAPRNASATATLAYDACVLTVLFAAVHSTFATSKESGTSDYGGTSSLAMALDFVLLLCGIAWLVQRLPPSRTPQKLGLRIVMVSDTHGLHRKVHVPHGDIFIHAGDYTHFGKEEDAHDLNTWIGTLPHQHKIVVQGNHDYKNPWSSETKAILKNANVLIDDECALTMDNGTKVRIFGMNFRWPILGPLPSNHELASLVPSQTDILVTHGPAHGYVDDNHGCSKLLGIVRQCKPRLVVSGHMHGAHGVVEGRGRCNGVTFVNAANCKDGYSIGWEAITIDI